MEDAKDNFILGEIQPTQSQIELNIRELKSENWNLEWGVVFPSMQWAGVRVYPSM